uniref:Uncharacterized protein n=1 Tax=Rhizophora mucronata TaxID=61149 RepID=A0A2P2Q8S4_RHIMU
MQHLWICMIDALSTYRDHSSVNALSSIDTILPFVHDN